jgi:hypothetical protein
MLIMFSFIRRRSVLLLILPLLAACQSTPPPVESTQAASPAPPTNHHEIRVVVVEDCPGAAPTAARVRSVAAQLGIHDLDLRIIMVRTPEEAIANQMLGSPTVLIDGIDIEISARNRTDFAIACRTYGGTSIPPVSLVEAAIREAWTRRSSRVLPSKPLPTTSIRTARATGIETARRLRGTPLVTPFNLSSLSLALQNHRSGIRYD